MLTTALAVAAALVGLAFSMATFERWLARHRRHELAWSLALLLFAAAALSLAAGAGLGWDPISFRCFYLFGAIVNVPVLALGTVYLLAGPRRGDVAAAGVGLLCAFAAGVVAVAPLTAAIPVSRLAQGSEVFGPLPRILAAVCSGGGALVVFGGALLSAWRVVRDRRRGAAVPARLLLSNVLLAAGTVVLSASGTLNSVFGAMNAFAVTLVVGVTVLFAGFLVATAAPRARAHETAGAPRSPTSSSRADGVPPLRPSAALDAAASRRPRAAATPRS